MHDIKPIIISRKLKSEIYGAQYLHKPIPGLSSQLPTGEIRTERVGTPKVYAERVYGLGTTVTSWDLQVPSRAAWDLRKTYDLAWEKFQGNIIDYTLEASDVEEFTSQFDLVISTIPLWAICQQPSKHKFDSINTAIKKGIDLHGLEVTKKLGDNWVIYNGTHGFSWYRCSSIFGHTSAEARDSAELMERGWESGYKVVGNTCTCHTNVVRAGRMGLWTRGVLTHHAFEQTIEAISNQFGAVSNLASERT